MFEVGATYEFHMLENGVDVTFYGAVESYEHPLIKLADTEPVTIIIQYGADVPPTELGHSQAIPGRIINITSSAFVSAQKKPD